MFTVPLVATQERIPSPGCHADSRSAGIETPYDGDDDDDDSDEEVSASKLSRFCGTAANPRAASYRVRDAKVSLFRIFVLPFLPFLPRSRIELTKSSP